MISQPWSKLLSVLLPASAAWRLTIRARQIESISKQVGGKVEGTKKVICSQMDLSKDFHSLVATLSKVLDFKACFRPQNDLESEK